MQEARPRARLAETAGVSLSALGQKVMAPDIIDQHTQLLERFWRALTRGDREGLAAAFAEDAVWHIPPYYTRLSDETGGSLVVQGRVGGFFTSAQLSNWLQLMGAIMPATDRWNIAFGWGPVRFGKISGACAQGGPSARTSPPC